MLLVIDNYDSFTYNLVQRFGEIDPQIDIQVVRNDQMTTDEIAALRPERIVVSPGPCTPREAGVSVEAIRRFSPDLPMLGVCLGHQSIGEAFGAEVVRADQLMHGKTDLVHHHKSRLMAGLNNPFQATRYHSLVIKPDTLPDELLVTAWCEESGASLDEPSRKVIMGLEHVDRPLFGVQFHPESFLTLEGTQLLERFLGV